MHLRCVSVGTLRLQGCGEDLAGHPDEVVVRSARHRAELEEVASHREAKNTAHDDGGSQLGIRAAETCGQIADSLVEMDADGFRRLWHGQHGPDQGPHLGGQCNGADFEDFSQMICGFFGLARREPDGSGEERRLGPLMLQDQGRVDPGPAGNAPPSSIRTLGRRTPLVPHRGSGPVSWRTGCPARHGLGVSGALAHCFTLRVLSDMFFWGTVDSTFVERLATPRLPRQATPLVVSREGTAMTSPRSGAPTRALVLGGGGAVGVGWQTGLLTG